MEILANDASNNYRIQENTNFLESLEKEQIYLVKNEKSKSKKFKHFLHHKSINGFLKEISKYIISNILISCYSEFIYLQ